MSKNRLCGVTALLLVFHACRANCAEPLPDFDVEVEIENVSGEKKTDWPVILKVWKIFGNHLPAGSLHPKGFHIFDPQGQEVPHALEALPPFESIGDDELSFVIPALEAGQKLVYRIANTAQESARRQELDLVNHPHNLIANGDFEAEGTSGPADWTGQGRLDPTCRKSGKKALLLEGASPQSMKLGKPIGLHKGSFYYFGAWGKTENVTRWDSDYFFGGTVRLKNFHNGFNGVLPNRRNARPDDPPLGTEAGFVPQCATRDWFKYTFVIKGKNEWGVEDFFARAAGEHTALELALDQKRQFWMPKDQAAGKWWLDGLVLMEQPRVTVRFDKLLAPRLKDGIFLFTRPAHSPLGNTNDNVPMYGKYCAFPFPREECASLDRYGLKGQRVPYLLGLYLTRPLAKVRVTVEGGALEGPGGARLPVEELEFGPGFLGEKRTQLIGPHTEPVDLAAPGLPYFCATFLVPPNAKPGRYAGKLVLSEGGRALREIPIVLRVQDLSLPAIKEPFVGMIFQGNFSEQGLKLYAKSGFNAVTVFDGFFKYQQQPGGDWQVDLDDLGKRLAWLAEHGIAGGVAPFTDTDLGSKWGGGELFKKVKTKEGVQREVKRIEEFVAKHPEWPRIIYMTWDEPKLGAKWSPPTKKGQPGGHGGPDPRMGWINEVAPDAPTTLDCALPVFEHILPYYNMPAIDDPAHWGGPEVYRYLRSIGKGFGFAAHWGREELSRYQTGIMMASSGARYRHVWHLANRDKPMDVIQKKYVRSVAMVAAGEGMDDLKIYSMLKQAIADAQATGDAETKKMAGEAGAYLAGVFATWDADHACTSTPFRGFAYQWGYDAFYGDWQERMARFAAALKGVEWLP